jgi:hypothetical protein
MNLHLLMEIFSGFCSSVQKMSCKPIICNYVTKYRVC